VAQRIAPVASIPPRAAPAAANRPLPPQRVARDPTYTSTPLIASPEQAYPASPTPQEAQAQ